MSIKENIFLNISTYASYLNKPFGVNMGHLSHFLFKEISEKQNTEDPLGWKKIPEESDDAQIVNPGFLKVEINWGTPGFGVFEEPLAIPR